jgi:hypothetical protein
VRLVAFGCSYTQGIGLNGLDYTYSRYYDSPLESVLKVESASKDAWPHLLADKLGIECINLGQGGNSSKFVFQMIREFDFQETDIVVIQWPQPERHVIWQDGMKVDALMQIAPGYGHAVNYYRHYYTTFDSCYNTAVYIENTHTYLKDKCKALYSVSYNDPEEMVEDKTLKATFPILADVGKFFITKLGDDICADGHPGKTYHEEFANRMAEKIKS